MKKYIIGAVAGAIIATTISAYADEGLEKIEAYIRKGLPITLNGSHVTLESPPVMVDGSTYLKLRDVASLTGLNVNWNEAAQTVELSNGTENQGTAVGNGSITVSNTPVENVGTNQQDGIAKNEQPPLFTMVDELKKIYSKNYDYEYNENNNTAVVTISDQEYNIYKNIDNQKDRITYCFIFFEKFILNASSTFKNFINERDKIENLRLIFQYNGADVLEFRDLGNETSSQDLTMK
jgi:hypothetical protein